MVNVNLRQNYKGGYMKTWSEFDWTYKAVNWFDEGLGSMVGDDNNGFIHGIYLLNKSEEVIDVEWFFTQESRDKELHELTS